MTVSNDFYLRYYVGHTGRYGHEFLEFEVKSNGSLRYANNSNYKKDSIIKKEMFVSPLVLEELQKIITDSGILQVDDAKWPEPNIDGKQELEIVDGQNHICFTTSKIGSMLDIQNSQDIDGLRTFYHLIQDLKCLVFSLISLHFKLKPI